MSTFLKWTIFRASLICVIAGLAACDDDEIKSKCKGNANCESNQYCSEGWCIDDICNNQTECLDGRKCWNGKCIESVCNPENKACDLNATCTEPSDLTVLFPRPTCDCRPGYIGDGFQYVDS